REGRRVRRLPRPRGADAGGATGRAVHRGLVPRLPPPTHGVLQRVPPMKLPVLREEFPPGADTLDDLGRPDFLKLARGTLALASCARQPAEHLLPAPRGSTGTPLHYATCITLGGIGTPLLVTARDGRPVKIEGAPEHPLVRGASGPLEQAELH